MALALSILWILAAFLVMWGASLMWRGLFLRGEARRRLLCPSCGAAVDGLVCQSCKYEGQGAGDFLRPRSWRLFVGAWIPVVAGVGAGYGAEVVRGWFGDSMGQGSLGLGSAQGAALGVALFAVVLGVWSYRGDRPRGRRRCPKCWYDMSGSKLSCPECGHDAGHVKRLYRPRRRMRGVAVAAVLLVASWGVWVTPRVMAGGAVGAVPSWVLIAGVEWWPDWMMVPTPAVRASTEEWTLLGRWQSGRLWGPERWLFKRRARSLLLGGASAGVLRRVMPVLDARDEDLGVPVHLAVVRGLTSPDPAERAAAADPFVWFRIDEKTRLALERYSEALFRALEDPVPMVQAHAAWYLAEMQTDPERLLTGVFEAIRKSATGPMLYQRTLYTIAFHVDRAEPIILNASRDADANVRVASIYPLARLNTDAGTGRLIEMLEDPDPMVAQAAADSLAMVTNDANRVIPALVSWWARHTDSRLRFPVQFQYGGEQIGPHMGAFAGLMAADHATGMHVLDRLTRLNVDVDYGPVIPVLTSIAEGDSQVEANEAKRLLGAIEVVRKMKGE